MVESIGIKTSNGMPLYLVCKLTNDFDTIFCQALGNSINFICAQDHLNIVLKIYAKTGLFSNENMNWNYSYSFKSKDVKNKIGWFRSKANSNENQTLNIIPHPDKLVIYNNDVDTNLGSTMNNPPIPVVPEMNDGIHVKISNLKQMISQIRAINGEIIKLKCTSSSFKMMNPSQDSTVYTVNTLQDIDIKDGNEKSTRCFKAMLLISCQLASEIGISELRYYHGGAIQITSKGDYASVRCLLTTV